MNTTWVQLKFREHQLLDELEQVWSDMADLSASIEIEGSITPAQTINILKLMILEGQGAWLTEPVKRTENALVTSADALRAASRVTGIGTHLLKGSLSRAQCHPVLACRGGELILRIDG